MESAGDSDFNQAKKYYLLAYGVSEPGLSRAVALRNLGIFFMSLRPVRKLEDGRKYLKLSADEVRNAADPYSRYTLALTLHSWGLAELSNANPERAQPLIEEARTTYKAIADGMPLGRWAREKLERTLAPYPGWSQKTR